MKPRHKKFIYIVVALTILGSAVGLVLYALQNNVSLFFTPTQVFNKEAPQGRHFRIGGLVEEGTVKRQSDGLTIEFMVTDTTHSMPVIYKGLLPDLFKEGKGVVAQGKLRADNVFVAEEVLAKHDENYVAPEAALALEQAAKAKAALGAASAVDAAEKK